MGPMSSAEPAGGPPSAPNPAADFLRIEEALSAKGPGPALEALCAALERDRKYPQLFEGLLMQSRFELGLPLVPLGPAGELPEELLRPHEEAIARACRRVGGLYLKEGDIVAAWPYFRALGETAPVAAAIDQVEPGLQRKDLEELIDIAIHQGANPPRGLELLLQNSGICSAITAMERSPPASRAGQEECARVLVEALHRELYGSVAADIGRREAAPAGQPASPPPTSAAATLTALVAGRPWLFQDGGYHVDPSHLWSVVRLSAALSGGPALAPALEMAEYGKHLAPIYHYRSDPPFEEFYSDHAIYLRGRLPGAREDNERAARHFAGKARQARARGDDRYPLGAVLEILVRLDRPREAVELSLELDGNGSLGSPITLSELCQRAGEFSKLAEASRRRGDLLGFTAGLLQSGRSGGAATPARGGASGASR
jgi:hypothetical protein